MDKKEMASRVSDVLQANGIRKPIKTDPQNFTITGPGGSTAVFTVSPHSSTVKYTKADVERVINACVAVALDAIRRGEEVSLYGFGTIKAQYHKPRTVNSFGTGDIEIPAQYLPKLIPSAALKRAAISRGLTVDNHGTEEIIPYHSDDSIDEDGGDE